MPNSPVVTSANVLVGSARMLIAAMGTALPTILTPATNPTLSWLPAWEEVGATTKGTDLSYSPSLGDIMVDESASSLGKILKTEKATLSAVLAESTLVNLNKAISASTLTVTAPGALQAGTSEVDVGSGTLVYCMVGLEGISPAGFPRYIIAYKAMAASAVKMAFARTAVLDIPISFELLADPTKPLGAQLIKIVDITAVSTS